MCRRRAGEPDSHAEYRIADADGDQPRKRQLIGVWIAANVQRLVAPAGIQRPERNRLDRSHHADRLRLAAVAHLAHAARSDGPAVHGRRVPIRAHLQRVQLRQNAPDELAVRPADASASAGGRLPNALHPPRAPEPVPERAVLLTRRAEPLRLLSKVNSRSTCLRCRLAVNTCPFD